MSDGRANLPWSAVAALKTVMLKAGKDAFSVHQHRAGSTGSLVTALLGASQIQMITKEVELGHTRVARQIDE